MRQAVRCICVLCEVQLKRNIAQLGGGAGCAHHTSLDHEGEHIVTQIDRPEPLREFG